MKKKIFSLLQYLIFLGIGIFLTWWQLGKMSDLQRIQFRESLANANYIYVVPIVILALLGHLSRAVRWKILLEPIGYFPSTANAFYATMCGYFANTFLPRVGEILRCTLLSRYEKIPVTKLFGTIIIERILDLFCYFLLIIFTFLIQIHTVRDFIKDKLGKVSVGKDFSSWLLIIIILIAVLITIAILKWILIKYKDHRLVIRISGLHLSLKEGYTTILHLKKRKQFIAHTIFIWATYLLQVYIGFSALPATESLGIGAAFSVLSLATLAMIVSPGGLGAFPVAVQQVLLIYNIDNISFGWLMWGVTTVIIVITGIICFWLLIYQNKNQNKNEEKRYTIEKNY